MQQLFAWQAIVTSQTRLQSSRYQVGLDRPTSQTYRNLLTKLPQGSVILEAAYEAIENKIKQVIFMVYLFALISVCCRFDAQSE